MSSLTTAPAPAAAPSWRWRGAFVLPPIRWAALATALFAVGGAAQLAGWPAWSWWALYLACYAAGGWEPAWAGLQALRARSLDVDLLMIVAAIGAAAIGQVFDGALLIVIFATSGALEAWATHRTEGSVRALLQLAPEQATRLGPGGREEVVDTGLLVVGDVVLVRPGERIGADAVVTGGASDVDQASITGEPMPVARTPGDEVFAGTLNGTGAMRLEVTRAAAESVVARIVALVAEASATKAEAQLFIEKIERRYSVGVVAATLVLFLVPLAFGASLQATLLRAMTFMIVASPCAVVLATMPPLLSAIANAGRHGVLVKSAVVMEQLGTVDTVAFDKTGTLTEGSPRVDQVHALPGSFCGADTGRCPGSDTDTGSDAVLRFAAAAEQPSEHPLGAAVVAAARERRLAVPAAVDFRSTPGRGVSAVVAGSRVEVGAPILLGESASPESDSARAVVAAAEAAGSTAVVVLVDQRPAGVLTLTDRLRGDAAATVAALTVITGRAPILLTGDNPAAAARLGREVGIGDTRAGLLPADKVDHVRQQQALGRRVLLVGDGVNDAPAMAAADLGLAMGRHGSDLALETSDAVIVRDELATLPAVVELSRRARRVIGANLIFAATVIAGLVTWDLIGHLPLPLGVAGHEGSTVVVGLNGLRLLRNRAWLRAGSIG